jgi:hypothetical protein
MFFSFKVLLRFSNSSTNGYHGERKKKKKKGRIAHWLCRVFLKKGVSLGNWCVAPIKESACHLLPKNYRNPITHHTDSRARRNDSRERMQPSQMSAIVLFPVMEPTIARATDAAWVIATA